MMDLSNPTLRERFEAKYIRSENPNDCWIWTAGQRGKTGYGQFSLGKINRIPLMRYAHRVSWELYRGPIPEGYQIDHLCRVRACVNPNHLEPVTQAENIRRQFEHKRKTHVQPEFCKRGHSDWVPVGGGRWGFTCAECKRIRGREWMQRKRDADRGGDSR